MKSAEHPRDARPPNDALVLLIRVWSVTFIALAVVLLVNAGIVMAGLPGYSNSNAYLNAAAPLGSDGLTGLAIAGLAVLALRFFAGGYHRAEWLAMLAVLLLTGPAALASLRHEGTEARPLGQMVAAVSAVAVGGALAPQLWRLLTISLGSVWAWGSVSVGVLTAGGLITSEALTKDSTGRYGDWAGYLGLEIDGSSVASLAGLSPHRQTLGAAMAMLLVLQVRFLAAGRLAKRRPGPWFYLGAAGSMLAFFWTLSRTSFAAAGIGVIAGFVPWERFRRAVAVAILWGAYMLLLVLPLTSLLRTDPDTLPSGTYKWRLLLWQAYLDDPSSWGLTGSGPLKLPPLGAGHAHNLLVEVLAGGGLLAAAGLLVGLGLLSMIAVSAAGHDSRIVLSLLVTFVALGALEMPSSARNYDFAFPMLVLCLAVGAASSALVGLRSMVHRDSRDAAPPRVSATSLSAR